MYKIIEKEEICIFFFYFAKKLKTRYNDLVEANMFVKNLENIQGDERDIMILSTTFGKTSEGRFIQNFGPVNNQTKGYR